MSRAAAPLTAGTVAALLAACAIGSCGGNDGGNATASAADTQAIRSVVGDARRAFAARDAAAICALLTKQGKVTMGAVMHRRPTTCRRDIRRYFRWLGASGSSGAPRVVDVRVDGRDARAGLALPAGERIDMPLTHEDDRWKLGGVFNATVSTIQNNAIGIPPPPADRPPPAPHPDPRPAGDAVAVWNDDGDRPVRCGKVDASFFPTVTGGCTLEVTGRAKVAMVSPFGTLEFAPCHVSYVLSVGGDGRTWSQKFGVWGKQPCTDASVCAYGGNPVPWGGQVYRAPDGSIRHRIFDTCFDTCLGRFRGDLTATLMRPERGWNERLTRATAGKSGYRLDGLLRGRGGKLAITGADERPADA